MNRHFPFFLWIFLPIVAFAMLFSASATVYAQDQQDVTLTARVALGAACKEDRWIPIRVTVENKGADLNGRVQLVPQDSFSSTNSVYAVDVSLPTTSRKEFFLYVHPAGVSGRASVNLTVGGRELVTFPINIICVSEESLLIGLLADDPSSYDVLGEVSSAVTRARVVPLQFADLPDRAHGWEAMDALVISGVDTGVISDQQRAALKLWLAQGGKLLVIGGPKWQGTTAGLDDVLPLALNATRTSNDLSALAQYFGTQGALDTQAAVLAVGQVRSDANVLVSQDNAPLLVQRKIGFGAVYYLAADPGLEPLNSWSGMPTLYSDLLGSSSSAPRWLHSAWDSNTANQALAAIEALGLLPTFYIFCLLGVYILVIGPVNYFLLSRLKRQEWAWVTIPVFVIVFTLFAYFSGYLVRGTRPVLNRLAVVQAWDGVEQARVRALVGVYSPARSSYTMQSGGSLLLHPFGGGQGLQSNRAWLSLQQGADISRPDALVEAGGMEATFLDGNLPALSFTHHLVINLNEQAPLLSGDITNTSQYALHDAILVTPDQSRNLGEIGPGDTRQVQMTLSANPDGADFYKFMSQYYYGSSRSDDKTVRRDALMNAILPSQSESKVAPGIYLVGWVDDAVLSTGLQGVASDNVDTSLYILMLSPTFTQNPGAVKLTPGLFTWETSDFSPYHSDYGPPLSQAGHILDFKLAVPLPYRAVKSLTLTLSRPTFAGGNAPTDIIALLWDWESAAWVEPAKALRWGDNDIPDPERFVGRGGGIRLNIKPDPGVSSGFAQIGSTYFTLVVEP